MVADLGRNIFKLFQVQCSRFYSVFYAVHSVTEPSSYFACRIRAVGFITVALGDGSVSAYECRHNNVFTSCIVCYFNLFGRALGIV